MGMCMQCGKWIDDGRTDYVGKRCECKKPSADAIIVFKKIEHRIAEMWDRGVKGNLNPAYQYAFEIGLTADIDDALKKIGKKKVIRRKK